MKWTGASQVNPVYEAVAMEKAMRWAILSAEEAAEPVLTAFVLPRRDDKGSSYARWLSHQTVQAIATIDRSNFKFNAPRQWAYEQDQWCTPKRNVHFLIVANEAGLQHYVKQDQLDKGFACASQLGNPPQRSAGDDHTANSLTPRPVPAQALLKGHKYYSHGMVT